ncbi:MAG TPA: YjbH domain-containing protein [Melioribacteraceae bacterium]|nr:YjbH domain-containing protein [Melioribacteraceae bacterium]
MVRKVKYFILIMIVVYSHVLSQSDLQIAGNISGEGLENVSVRDTESELFIEFENRVYRFEIDALVRVLKLISPEIGQYQKINLLIKNKNVPVTQISVSAKDLLSWNKGEISNTEFSELIQIDLDNHFDSWSKAAKSGYQNSSNLRFDIVLKPTYRFQFGVFSNPVLYQLNFAPHIEFGLWKGMTGLFEVTFPIHNDFTPSEDSIRASRIVLNQTARLGNSTFISGSIGYFTLNRYGFDLETRTFFLNGDLSLGLNLGYTGYAFFAGKKLYYSDLYQWTGSLGIDYRIREYDLSLAVTAGKFLLFDNTIRFDIYRDFGEIQVGFFAMRSLEGISNGGFSLSIPLFPSKYWNPGFFRIRTTEYLDYSYRVKIADQIGLKYDTGFSLSGFIEKLNPGFIKNYLGKRLN